MIKWQKRKFGQFIRNARIEAGLTQKELSELIKISPAYVSKIERGDLPYSPTKEILERLAKVLKIDLDVACGFTARFDERYSSLFNKHKDDFPILLKVLDENPKFALNVFAQTKAIALSQGKTSGKTSK
jgi:HTH-type transcriptional regulator, competence development regulator